MVAFNYSRIKSITQATCSRNEKTPPSELECGNLPVWQMRSISAAMCRRGRREEERDMIHGSLQVISQRRLETVL